ncbi:MAG: HepT-like ribonuclease domain-containing protein [Campylobacterota bacterium]|nr:HepT-like ribonuclease domain-containing protein [Campylobacterota bacterium]
MSKYSLDAKVNFILEMCVNIQKIVKRHKGIVSALEDYEGQMALLMGIAQIGETLKKIDDDVIEKYDLVEDKQGAYYTRNYIVHDYEGVDLSFMENTIREYLPKLEEKFLSIRDDLAND